MGSKNDQGFRACAGSQGEHKGKGEYPFDPESLPYAEVVNINLLQNTIRKI